MRIERCSADDSADLLRLRRLLWPEQESFAAVGGQNAVAFIARATRGVAVGFAEATLRYEPVNGCDTSPVLFLEGIYVVPAHRRNGTGRALCDAVAAWGRSLGCTEFASDALLDNAAGHAFHAALGFAVAERIIVFRKPL